MASDFPKTFSKKQIDVVDADMRRPWPPHSAMSRRLPFGVIAEQKTNAVQIDFNERFNYKAGGVTVFLKQAACRVDSNTPLNFVIFRTLLFVDTMLVSYYESAPPQGGGSKEVGNQNEIPRWKSVYHETPEPLRITFYSRLATF